MQGLSQDLIIGATLIFRGTVNFYWVANRQTQSRSVFDFVFFLFFFSMSGKVLPISPLLSGVFVYKVFCAYFVSFEGTGVMCRFPW